MRHRFSMTTYIISAFFIIGVLSFLFKRASTLLTPIIVFGIIFLLYKYPPSFFRKRRNPTQTPPGKNGRMSQKAKFRVIKGSKEDDSQEPPKYH